MFGFTEFYIIKEEGQAKISCERYILMKKVLNFILDAVLFVALFVGMQIPTLAEVAYPWETIHQFKLYQHILLLLISVPILFFLLYWYSAHVHNKLDFKKKITLKNLLIMALGVLGQDVIQKLLQPLAGSDPDAGLFHATLHTTLAPIELINLCLLSPILEEMLFQGAFQKGILKKMKPVLAIVITAVFFAFCHGNGLSWITVSLLAPAFAYAITYQLTGDIKMAILCHGLSNLIAVF